MNCVEVATNSRHKFSGPDTHPKTDRETTYQENSLKLLMLQKVMQEQIFPHV